MPEYEVLVETINPCGGAKHCIKEFMDVETNDPIAWVKANGRFPIRDTANTPEGDLKIITGDEAGNIVNYTFTEMTAMNTERITLPALTVIGREGSTHDGPGFIQKLWAEANGHFPEIEPLVRRDESGTPVGFWGAMSDFSLSFRPWENDFSEGLYLAGAECAEDAAPPEGWTKWVIPAFEYLKVENADFPAVLRYMAENHLPLAGAVHDFTDPATGRGYMLFPIRKL